MSELKKLLATHEPGGSMARVADFRHRAALLRHMDCMGVRAADVHSIWIEDISTPDTPSFLSTIRVHYSANGSGFCRHFHPDQVEAWLGEPATQDEVERLLPLHLVPRLVDLCARANPNEEERCDVEFFARGKSLAYVTDSYETVRDNVREYLRSGLACLTEVQASRDVVWVNAGDGCCVGRFGPNGVDVHHGTRVQVETGRECLDCTHERPTPADWDRFVLAMRKLGADVAPYRPAWLDEPPGSAPVPGRSAT